MKKMLLNFLKCKTTMFGKSTIIFKVVLTIISKDNIPMMLKIEVFFKNPQEKLYKFQFNKSIIWKNFLKIFVESLKSPL